MDVGGATGEVAAELAKDGHAVTLVDLSHTMIEEARRRRMG
ncbi:MAG: class I SAM-dependent methyltransferase [Chloroflexi bacterium]|nr:class I SAM-dependent methyltransferase [Chloroflexota bacterium]